MRKVIIVDAMLMNIGMTTWDVSQDITMEAMMADIRITVASPLVEVEEAVTKVNTGVTMTLALHIFAHMGYEHFLNIVKVIFHGEQEADLCLRKFVKVVTTLPFRSTVFSICVLHKKFTKTNTYFCNNRLATN